MIVNNVTLDFHSNVTYKRITDAPYLALYKDGRRIRVLPLDELIEYCKSHNLTGTYAVYPRKSRRTRATYAYVATLDDRIIVRDKYTGEKYLSFDIKTFEDVHIYNSRKTFDIDARKRDAIFYAYDAGIILFDTYRKLIN